jgi:hypothetical protein
MEAERQDDIREVLSRRVDLSLFVVHLTRAANGRSAKNNLKRILRKKVLEAGRAFGPAEKVAGTRNHESQRCVSFSEVPLTHLGSLTSAIPKRQIKLSPYGVAFTKMRMRERGANPVWYVDITPTHEWLMNSINRMITAEVRRLGRRFWESDLANLCPFIEQMGSGPRQDGFGYKKEFWWEREWRHKGNFNFGYSEIAFGLAPEADVEELEDLMRRRSSRTSRKIRFLDPAWSADKMIAHLCGSVGALTPFTPAEL